MSTLRKPRVAFWVTLVSGAGMNAGAIVVAMAVPNRGLFGHIMNLLPYLAYWPNLLVGRTENEWFDPHFWLSILINITGWLLLAWLVSILVNRFNQ